MAARFADPELSVRHVCAARLVAGKQSVDVEAPLPRRLDHHLGKGRERLAEEEVARHPLVATGAELIELVETGEERGEEEELAHLPADLEQAPRRLDVEGGRGDQVENGPEDCGGIRGVAIGPAQRPVQRRAAGVVARLEARAAPEQRLDQRHVAGESGEHQRREALRRGVVDAVLLGPCEHLLEVLPLEALESTPGDPRALRLVLLRGLEPALPGKAIGDQLLFVEAGQLEELLFGPARHARRRQRLVGERAQVDVVEYRPGDGPELQHLLADGLGLLLLALRLEPVRLPLPLLGRRFLRLHRGGALRPPGAEQLEQRMPDVVFHQDHLPDRAGERHIERVDEELVQLERPVALVFRPAILEPVAGQVLRLDPLAQLGEKPLLGGEEAVDDHRFVLEPLRFMNAEDERRAQLPARVRLLLVAQDDDSHLRRLACLLVQILHRRARGGESGHRTFHAGERPHQEIGLAVDGAEFRMLEPQHPVGRLRDRVAVAIADVEQVHVGLARLAQPAPEEALHLGPGEEVRVDDLVGVARDDELPRRLERPEHERKLDVGEVLHFVDRDEVVDRLHVRQRGMGDEVRLVQVFRCEPGAVAFEQLEEDGALLRIEHRLTHAEAEIRITGERPLRLGGEHAAQLLEGLVGVGEPDLLPVALEEGDKVTERHWPALGHSDGLEQLAVAEEVGLLILWRPVEGDVKRARGLGKPLRFGDVGDAARHLPQPLQEQRRLPAAGRAHQHQRGPVAERGVLQVVEGEWLVEVVEDGPSGMEVAQGPRLCSLRRFRIFQFRLVHRRAAQEARAVVRVPADHFEREARLFAAVLGEHEEEPRGIVEPGPVKPAQAQLFHVGGAEIVPLDSRAHLLDLVREVAGRQPVVGEKAH